MTATQRARELVKAGQPYGLAIHIAANEHGTSTRAVASELAGRSTRHRKHKSIAPADAWWNK